MPKPRLTLEYFIEKASIVHNNKYDYIGPYINNSTKITIICPKHGKFKQQPNNHLQGNGCPTCKVESRRLTFDQFKQKAKNVHGDKYEYPGPFTKTNEKINIVCDLHGLFQQNANSHLNGHGCVECSGKNLGHTFEKFKDKAEKLHKRKYCYYPPYINAKTPVNILCKDHGWFKQTPDNHLHGQGCPKCSNHSFNKNVPSVVYLLELKNRGEHFVKVGVSNNFTQRRYEITADYPIIDETLFWFAAGVEALKIEQMIKNHPYKKYTPLNIMFKGKTECYSLNEKQHIYNFITKVVQSKSTTITSN